VLHEWISVKDRLPEMNGRWYLVNLSGYVAQELNIIDTYIAHGQATWYGYIGRGRALPVGAGISHWMPLPDPPRDQL
jgi:hypothetical protein